MRSHDTTHRDDAALLIDWENLKYSLASRGRRPNLTALREAVQELGRVVIARAYADWEHAAHRATRDQSALYAAGIEPVYVPSRFSSALDGPVKNSVDVKIAADCVEICHTRPSIQIFILVTGDADLLHLAHALQPYGKRVVVIGTSWSTSSRWVECVDEVIHYDVEVDPLEPQPLPAPPDGLPDLDELFRILVGFVEEQGKTGRVPLLSYLGYRLRRRLPGFHPSHYGFLKLKDLIREAERRNLVQIRTVGMEDWVSLPDAGPFSEVADEGEEFSTAAASDRDESVPRSEEEEAVPVTGPRFSEAYGTAIAPDDLEMALRDLVITADEIARDERYHYMSLGFLKQCLYRKAVQPAELLPPTIRPGSPALRGMRSSRHLQCLIEEAQRRNWLVEGTPTRRLDPRTGSMSAVQTWVLNRQSPQVIQILEEVEVGSRPPR